MEKIVNLLEEKFMIGRFSFSIYSKFKVKVKKVIQKHNQEINWAFRERNERDNKGDRIITFELNTDNESVFGLNKNPSFFIGLIEDIYNSVGGHIDEETAERYNAGFIGVTTGEEVEKNNEIDSKSINKKITYYFYYNKYLIILGDINKIIEIEKKYPQTIRNIYGETVQEYYTRNVGIMANFSVSKEDFEKSKFLVERLENTTNVKKIPSSIKKFIIAGNDKMKEFKKVFNNGEKLKGFYIRFGITYKYKTLDVEELNEFEKRLIEKIKPTNKSIYESIKDSKLHRLGDMGDTKKGEKITLSWSSPYTKKDNLEKISVILEEFNNHPKYKGKIILSCWITE